MKLKMIKQGNGVVPAASQVIPIGAGRVVTAAILIFGLIAASSARAAAIFSFTQVGNDLVGTLSGSLNITGANNIGNTPSYGPYIGAEFGQVIATPGAFGNGLTGTAYAATGPSSFGTGFANGTATGGVFEVSLDDVVLPTNYAGGALTNTLTVPNESLASLGITAGDYVYTITGSNDTVTLQFAVPEPASLGLLALGSLGVLARRRRTA